MVRRRAAGVVAGVLAAASLAAGCGGGSPARPKHRTPPDLAAFLRLPVATPSACPTGVVGATAGRRSPWVGHVDISVFVDDHATGAQVQALGDRLRGTAHVSAVYFESKRQAWEEYRRLYTCSDAIDLGTLPASYRLVLGKVTHAQRDAVVRTVRQLPAVADVSCDPFDPCTAVR